MSDSPAETLWSLLASAADRDAGRLNFTDGTTYSWISVLNRAEEFARGLIAEGPRIEGGVVAMLVDNSLDFVVAFFGSMRVGALPVALSTELRGMSLERALVTTQAEIVIKGRSVEDFSTDRPVRTVDDLVREANNQPDIALPPPPDDPLAPALLMMTSGTTGASKAILYSHAAAIRWIDLTVWNLGYNQRDVVYTCLPLNHIAGLLCEFGAALTVGADLVVAPRFSVSTYWDDIVEHGITKTNTLGSITALLCHAPHHPAERRHKLVMVRRSGINRELTLEFETRFGVRTTEMYGMSDAGPITAVPPDTHMVDTCGRLTPGLEARLVDSNGGICEGEGELQVKPERAGVLPMGYWRGRDHLDAFTDGWFATGDLMAVNSDGWYRFVARAKDVIRRSGENLAPIDIETAILEHPDVEDVAAYAVPAEFGEDDVMVSLVVVDGHELDLAVLRQFLSSRLPYYALPRYVRIVPELPRTATAKVRVADLRARGRTDDTVDLGSTSRSRARLT